jgi:hypothetical protein
MALSRAAIKKLQKYPKNLKKCTKYLERMDLNQKYLTFRLTTRSTLQNGLFTLLTLNLILSLKFTLLLLLKSRKCLFNFSKDFQKLLSTLITFIKWHLFSLEFHPKCQRFLWEKLELEKQP